MEAMGEQKRKKERERERERGGMIGIDIESINWRDKESGVAYNGRR